MATIEGHTIHLADGGVKATLHFIQLWWDHGEREEVGGVDVVKEAVGGTPVVGEEGVCSRGVDGELFPLLIEGQGRGAVVCRRRRVVVGEGDLGHGG